MIRSASVGLQDRRQLWTCSTYPTDRECNEWRLRIKRFGQSYVPGANGWVQKSPRIPNQHQHPTIIGALQQAALRYMQETDESKQDRKGLMLAVTKIRARMIHHALHPQEKESKKKITCNYLWNTNWIQILTKRWISRTTFTGNCFKPWSPTWNGCRNQVSENTKLHWNLIAQLFMFPHGRLTDNCERVTKNCTKKSFTVETL